jgi:hypothetical protein
MSVDSSSTNLTGFSVYTKENEDHPVGRVEDVMRLAICLSYAVALILKNTQFLRIP